MPRMRKLQNIIYEGELTHCNYGPAFLDGAGQNREMQLVFDDKMGHGPHEMEVLGEQAIRDPSREFLGNELFQKLTHTALP